MSEWNACKMHSTTLFCLAPVVCSFKVATLNTDTFKLEPTAPVRAELQRGELHGYDVICITSVFNSDMQHEWIAAMKEEYSHSYVPPIAESKCGCPTAQYQATLPTFLENPGFASAPELFKEYGPDYFSCSTCFFNMYDGTAASLAACDLGDVPMVPQTGCFVENGAMGNFILSNKPLVEVQHKYFQRSTALRRGGIAVTVEDAGERHQVFCSHLQDGEYSRRAYPYENMTWNEENEWNGKDYLAFADHVGDELAKQYLTGDFNVGPAMESRFVARPIGMDNNVYSSVLARGWRNAYLEKPDAECGICFDNPRSASYDTIRNVSVPHSSQQASHIFTKNVDLTGADAHRIAVGPFNTSLGSTHLTDKYGIGLSTKARCDLLVIGGGIGGLATAVGWKRAIKDSKVCLVEADTRTGGRLLDVVFDGAPAVSAGLGGWYLGQGSTKMLALVEKYDIELEPFDFEKKWQARGKITDDWHDLAKQFAVPEDLFSYDNPKAWKDARLAAVQSQSSFGTYGMLLQTALGSEGASFYALWRGTPVGLMSTVEPLSAHAQREAWVTNVLVGPNGHFEMVRPVKGLSSVAVALRQECEDLGVEIHSGIAATKLDYGECEGSGYVTHLADGSTLLAGAVALAVPPHALAKIGGGLVAEMLAAPEFQGIDVGVTFKAAASFASPWWEGCGLATMQRMSIDPATACLGSIVPYEHCHAGENCVLHLVYAHGYCAERYAALYDSLSRKAFDAMLMNELRIVFAASCPSVTVPEPLQVEIACWACQGTGWGVSQRGILKDGKIVSMHDTMNFAAAPLPGHAGRLFLVGSDYSVESGWAEGALASAACALWQGTGAHEGINKTEWARRGYCDLGSGKVLV